MQFLTHRKHHEVELFKFGYSPIGKPYLSVYCYYFDGVLIDSAQTNCKEKVLETLKHKPINKILLTHWHEDHSGNTARLAKQHQASVYAHPFTQEKLRNGFEIHPYEKFLFGKTKPFKGQMFDFQEVINTNQFQLKSIYTPGHSEDHTVFLLKERGWLFSGDLFVGVKIRVFRKGERFWQQVDSMKRVLQEDFDVVFCGHHPRLKDGKRFLNQKLQYFEDFGGKVRHFASKGLQSKEIMKVMHFRENRLMKFLLSDDVSVKYMIQAAMEDS